MSDPAPGKVITFYSYKGGTGRSQALANVAWILASNWRRVLVIDWDLEAPGLHRYFAPFLFDESLAETDGLIEFVLEYAAKALECAGGEPGADGAWYKPLADISRFAVSVDYPFDGGGIIDLVPAGRQGPFYGERVRSFDWHNFYDRLGGGSFLEETRARFIGEYNYVLIDSRTGVSDISGICTAQMPDVLVACFTANNQSIDGTAAVAASARRQARPRAKPAVLLPVITRVDNSEKHKLERRRELARVEFDDLLPPEWGDEQREAYWGAAQVPYIPFYAYEEVLAPFDDQPGDAASMLTAMERLADTITGGDVKRLGVRPTKKECLEIQAKYARHKKLPPETREASAGEAVYDVYLSFRSRDRGLVRPIAERLRQVGVRFYFDEQDLQPGRNWQNDLQKALDASPACVVFVGEDLGVWQAQEVIGTVSQRLAASRGRFRVIPAILPGSSPARLPEFLRDIAPVDFNVDPDGAFDRLLNGIRGVAPSPVPSADTCPYKGLEPFDFKDARLFFGREDLVKQMLESLRLALAQRGASRLFGIIGASGSGKSSLARAGLLEALRRGEVGLRAVAASGAPAGSRPAREPCRRPRADPGFRPELGPPERAAQGDADGQGGPPPRPARRPVRHRQLSLRPAGRHPDRPGRGGLHRLPRQGPPGRLPQQPPARGVGGVGGHGRRLHGARRLGHVRLPRLPDRQPGPAVLPGRAAGPRGAPPRD